MSKQRPALIDLTHVKDLVNSKAYQQEMMPLYESMQYKLPIISFRSCDGFTEGLARRMRSRGDHVDTDRPPIYTVDRHEYENTKFGKVIWKEICMKARWQSITELLDKHPELVGNCVLWLLWTDTYELEVINKVRPKHIVVMRHLHCAHNPRSFFNWLRACSGVDIGGCLNTLIDFADYLDYNPRIICIGHAKTGNVYFSTLLSLAPAPLEQYRTTFTLSQDLATVASFAKCCGLCGRQTDRVCSCCRAWRFCSKRCQRRLWPYHRPYCKPSEQSLLASDYEKLDAID